MNRYAIYCTSEQTRKALELGAPILGLSSMTKEDITTIQCVKLDTPIHTDVIEGGFDYAIIPTAEQMIGWLEGQEITFDIMPCVNVTIHTFAWKDGSLVECIDRTEKYSRKEATLAAIDAALEYLINNRK